MSAMEQHDPVQAASPLLRLPGEIRNRIYEYALTSPKKLYFSATDEALKLRPAMSLWSGVSPEFNQLKYTCYQLYKETAGVEVQFNTVVFKSRSPGKTFSNFLGTCAPKKLSWFTTVHLVHSCYEPSAWLVEDLDTISEISQKCIENPHITVRYIYNEHYQHSMWHFRELRGFQPNRFLLAAVWLLVAVRGEEVPGILDTPYAIWYINIKARAHNPSKAVQRPEKIPNFCFWQNGSDESVLKLLKMHDDCDFWLPLVENWLKNGI